MQDQTTEGTKVAFSRKNKVMHYYHQISVLIILKEHTIQTE